eukprot:1999942-Rhodomonas_salina.2
MIGDGAQFDGVGKCYCPPGMTADATGECVQGSDELCQQRLGEHGAFDGVNKCVCDAGFEQVCPSSRGMRCSRAVLSLT